MVWLWLGKIVLKVVDQRHGFFKERLIFTAVHEQGFRANISGTSVRIVVPPFEIRRSENAPTVGVRGDAGETVGAAAFHADHQLTAAYGLSVEGTHVRSQILQDFQSGSPPRHRFPGIPGNARVFRHNPRYRALKPRCCCFRIQGREPERRRRFGWLIRSARIRRVFSWSSPIWEQP